MCGQGKGGEFPGGISEGGGGRQGDRGDLLLWGKVATNIKGTESSVPITSVWGLERHRPTMSMLRRHGYRVKKEEGKK